MAFEGKKRAMVCESRLQHGNGILADDEGVESRGCSKLGTSGGGGAESAGLYTCHLHLLNGLSPTRSNKSHDKWIDASQAIG